MIEFDEEATRRMQEQARQALAWTRFLRYGKYVEPEEEPEE